MFDPEGELWNLWCFADCLPILAASKLSRLESPLKDHAIFCQLLLKRVGHGGDESPPLCEPWARAAACVVQLQCADMAGAHFTGPCPLGWAVAVVTQGQNALQSAPHGCRRDPRL